MRRFLLFIIFLITVQGVFAQTDRDLIRQGNRMYAQHKYPDAEIAYRKAVAQNGNNSRALYNLGCALQKQHRDSDAINQYEQAVKSEPNAKIRSQAYYNMGVAYQTQKNYSEAIEAYKNCLRLNPGDNEARYNYVLCKRMQSQQQKNDSNNKNNNDKNKDNNKNKQNQNNDKNKDKNQQNKNKDNGGQQNQQNGEMSKYNAEQLLQAAMNEEQQTEAKLKKAMQQPSSRSLDKNW